MMESKISIIIPVYNVEPYIRKCLDSVLNQTYTNFEILLINDGTPDNCAAICDEYAKKDSRIRVFHKENGGLSSALNVGLNNFTGNYLGFVDSDDWIEPDMYEKLIESINGADVAICSYFVDTETDSRKMENTNQISEKLISKENLMLYPLKRNHYMGFCGYLWNKLYRADLIKKSGLFFDEKIKYAMDVLFFESLVSGSDCTGVYLNKPLYHYLQRSGAITKSESYDIKLDILEVYKEVEEILPSQHKYWARGFYCYHASMICELAVKKHDFKMMARMQEEIKKHFEDYKLTNLDFPDRIERMERFLLKDSDVTMQSVFSSLQDKESEQMEERCV